MSKANEHSVLYARIKPETHELLRQLARENERTITATVELAIKAAWQEHQESRPQAKST